MKKLSFLNKIIFLANNLFAVALITSFFVPNLAPDKYSTIALLGLLTPALLIINFIFILYWIIIGFKKQFILSFLILIISYFILSPLYKVQGGGDSANSENSLSIMTYNVRKFNKYHWIDTDSIDSKIGSFINSEYPDIVTIQEFKPSENFKLNYPYSYNHYSYNYYKKINIQSGLATFSKYPIVNKGSIGHAKFTSDIIYTDIIKKNDTIRIYNFHLVSLGVIPNEEYFGHKNSEKLIKRLSKSFKVQQNQIDSLNNHIKSCNYKVIVAGDMNNTAYSWAYKKIKNNYQDTFLEVGEGFGKTYAFKNFPFRIDYIFVDEKFKVNEHKNLNDKYSDHFPIVATVEF